MPGGGVPEPAGAPRAGGIDAAARGGILILHVETPDGRPGAEHMVRTRQPCRALGEMGEVTVVSGSLLSPTVHALLPHADVLVVADLADPDLLPVLDTRRRARRLSVYEINHHHLFPPPGAATPPRDLVGRSLSPQLARQSDCLQFPTEELERRFQLVNQRRAVFPSNRFTPVGPPPARADGVLRIGWGGARGHLEDVRWIAPALREAIARHPGARLAVHGHPVFRDLFSDLPADRFEFTPESSIEAYESFLSGLTIGVSPLLPTVYNRCRSDSKFLDYAAHHVMAICSALEPYAALRERDLGILFRGPDELSAVLDRAINAPDERAEMIARAGAFVDNERLERPHAPHRLGFYLATMASLGYVPESGRRPDSAPFFSELNHTPTFAGSRYVAIEDDSVESRLTQGLRAERAGEVDEALARFAEAAARAPTFHLPRLLAGTVERDPKRALEHLRRASELAPRSCRAAYEIGVRLHAMGDDIGARAAWERCRTLAPAFGAAETRLAELADASGHLEEACRRFQDAALQNSFLAWPVARLAAIAIDDGQVEKAAALLRPSLEHDEELWLTNFLIGRAYVEMGRFEAARVHLDRALEAPAGSGEDRAAILALLATVELRLGAPDESRARLDELRRQGEFPRFGDPDNDVTSPGGQRP